jgi:hypothetical protein
MIYLNIPVLLSAVLLLSLFVAKPSRDDFDRELAAMLREAIGSTTRDQGKDVLSNLAVVGCKMRPADCSEILMRTYSISSRDYIFVTRHDVTGPGALISCVGLLKQFICNASISVPTPHSALRSLWVN